MGFGLIIFKAYTSKRFHIKIVAQFLCGDDIIAGLSSFAKFSSDIH